MSSREEIEVGSASRNDSKEVFLLLLSRILRNCKWKCDVVAGSDAYMPFASFERTKRTPDLLYYVGWFNLELNSIFKRIDDI